MLFVSFQLMMVSPVRAEPEAGDAEPTPTPVKKRMPKEKKGLYDRSKLTNDRSELEADHRELILAAGVDKIVDLDSSIQFDNFKAELRAGNVRIVNVVPSSVGKARQLVFVPLEEGETSVTVRDKTGKVRIIFDVFVAKLNLVRYLERLRDKLKEVEGINVNIEDQKVVIRGEVLSPQDYGIIINELADKAYGDSVLNKVVMSAVTLNALAQKIQQDITVFAPTVKTSVLNGKIILEGTVENEGNRQRALRRAEWYLPAVRVSDPILGSVNIEKNEKPLPIIQSDIVVNAPPPKRDSKLVRISVYFVELSKDFLKSFGFKWQPGFTADPSISIGTTATGGAGTSTSSSGGFTFAGTLSSLFPALNSAPSSAAYGRILRSENIVVKSTEAGHVDDLENIPTLVLGPNGTTGAGQPQPVGFSSDITPTIIQNSDVDLSIKMTQTDLVGSDPKGQSITAKHSVSTRLYLKSGEIAAVASMNDQDNTTTFNRDDPTAGAAQVGSKPLFTLQRSKSTNKKRSQFVVFVSPQIIDSASDGTEDLKKNFRMKSGGN